jgi:N-methylhydantoinase A/oxoprolinase/acetone carboxylase beta subunit
VFEKQEPSSDTYGTQSLERLKCRLEKIEKEVRKGLVEQGFETERVETELYLNLRYDETSV